MCLGKRAVLYVVETQTHVGGAKFLTVQYVEDLWQALNMLMVLNLLGLPGKTKGGSGKRIYFEKEEPFM